VASKPIVVVAALWLLVGQAAGAAVSRNVLVLYSNNRLVPGNIEVDHGLRSIMTGPAVPPVQIFSEFLDRPDFGGAAYEDTETTYLREKYSARPPDAIVAVSDDALDFLLRRRAQLFPGTPVVHVAVSRPHLQSILALPADVVGVPRDYGFADTVAQALRWHPAVRHLLVVTGASEHDHDWEAQLHREIPAVAGAVSVEFLSGLATASVLERLGKLGADSLVFTPGYFLDGAGRLFSPRDSVALMAAAATAPVYGPFDTFIGTGVVGGRMPSFEDMGQQAAQIVSKLLAGAAPASLHLPAAAPLALRVDWRQIRRWGINDRAIPADTVVYFREPTFWDAYRDVAMAVAAVILLQAAMIVTLLLERRRRRTAEFAVQKQRIELAHFSRLAIAGELTASIAHEINQPLGAILTSADAADLLLQSDVDRRDDLRRIVARIRHDDLRASDVIRQLRALFAKREPERKPLDLNVAVADVEALLHVEAQRRHVTLDSRTALTPAEVVADRVQIQQVLIILVLNAMDAAVDVSEDRRTVGVSIARTTRGLSVVVRDRGQGVPPEHLPKLFESFFSTKQNGMGLGLSIARTIVEAHGGRIWAESGLDEGAAFHVDLPEAGTTSRFAQGPL
jgi:signal transduction histidine kinase